VLSERAPIGGSDRIAVSGAHELAAARAVAQTAARAVLGDDRLGDVALATSELVTNALEHGSGGPVEVTVSTSDDAVEISVISPSHVPPGRPSQQPAPASDVRGRGLRIVAAIADSVLIGGGDDRVSVTCRFER
jgi:anti-sigma regulatory factor (Ser/Thr protein kinase)